MTVFRIDQQIGTITDLDLVSFGKYPYKKIIIFVYSVEIGEIDANPGLHKLFFHLAPLVLLVKIVFELSRKKPAVEPAAFMLSPVRTGFGDAPVFKNNNFVSV